MSGAFFEKISSKLTDQVSQKLYTNCDHYLPMFKQLKDEFRLYKNKADFKFQ